MNTFTDHSSPSWPNGAAVTKSLEEDPGSLVRPTSILVDSSIDGGWAAIERVAYLVPGRRSGADRCAPLKRPTIGPGEEEEARAHAEDFRRAVPLRAEDTFPSRAVTYEWTLDFYANSNYEKCHREGEQLFVRNIIRIAL